MSPARKNDDGPAVRPVGHLENTQNDNTNCQGMARSIQALRGFCTALAKAVGVRHA